MLINSVIIVLREVLEAALVLSVLLAVCYLLGLARRWVGAALLLGLLGSAVLGYNMQWISDRFDGVGQEVVDASLQYLVYLLLAACVFQIVRFDKLELRSKRNLVVLMTLAVTFAVAREGSEILIFTAGFWQIDDFISSVGVGSVVGACIGVSIGVLFYYLLVSQPRGRALRIAVLILTFIGAGMSLQATNLLIQADWISVTGPLWSTAHILPEQSLPGQLLYALVGYEATPSAKEVVVYAASLMVIGALTLIAATAARKSTELDAHRI